MSVAASYHYPQQQCCCCPGGNHNGMAGGSMISGGMYGYGGMNGGMGGIGGGMYGGAYGAPSYGGYGSSYGSYGGYGGYGGMGGGMYSPMDGAYGYRIKPKTKLGWDHQTGSLRLKTKYKVKPMHGYPPMYAASGYGPVPSYVQNHPLSQYGAAGPTFGAPSYGQSPAMGYGQAPYYGQGGYNQYGSFHQRGCNW